MAKKRERKVVLSGISREQMEEAFGLYAAADANIVRINASMDERFTEIRNEHQDELARLERQKEEAFEVMQTYATEKREEVFCKRKSMETAHGVLGFRTGTPKLKTKKGFTWPSVLNLLKRVNPAYIRTADEVAKDKLLADREKEETQKLLEEVGVCVVQDETFFVECKKEEPVSV